MSLIIVQVFECDVGPYAGENIKGLEQIGLRDEFFIACFVAKGGNHLNCLRNSSVSLSNDVQGICAGA